MFAYLQPSGLAVALVDHFEIHIKLGGDRGVDDPLEPLLDESRKAGGQVEVGHADPDLAIVQLLEDLSVQLAQDGGPVRHQEPSPALGRLLEAHEGRVGGGPLRGRLAVQSDVVTAKARLIDLSRLDKSVGVSNLVEKHSKADLPNRQSYLLVQGVALGRELAQARAVEGIQARLQAERLVHFPVPAHVLHQLETSEPNRPVLQEILSDLCRVLGKVRGAVGVHLRGGPDLEGTRRCLSRLLLGFDHIDPAHRKKGVRMYELGMAMPRGSLGENSSSCRPYPSESHRVNGHSHISDRSGCDKSESRKFSFPGRFSQLGLDPAPGASRAGGASTSTVAFADTNALDDGVNTNELANGQARAATNTIDPSFMVAVRL